MGRVSTRRRPLSQEGRKLLFDQNMVETDGRSSSCVVYGTTNFCFLLLPTYLPSCLRQGEKPSPILDVGALQNHSNVKPGAQHIPHEREEVDCSTAAHTQSFSQRSPASSRLDTYDKAERPN